MKTSTIIFLSAIFGILPIFALIFLSFVAGAEGIGGTTDMHKMNWALLMWVSGISALGWVFISALLISLGFDGKKLNNLDKLEKDLYEKEEEVERLKKMYTNLIEKINVENFDILLWKKVNELLTLNKEEAALLCLYESLIDNLDDPSKCDSFLKASIGLPMSSDIIVHIFNAISPIKSELKHWNDFKVYATNLLIKDIGEIETQKLLKVT